jgi:hypothetical protein
MPVDPARLNAVGDLVLDDPRALRALADPKRLTLFDLVRREGTATSATLARVADRDRPSVENDLRELESLGLIEEIAGVHGEAAWSTPAKGIYFEIPEDPEGQAAARQLSNTMLAKYAGLPPAWVREQEPKLAGAWAREVGLFNARVRLTPDELHRIQEGLERLIEPFTARSTAGIPAGVAPVRILAFFMPEPDDDTR